MIGQQRATFVCSGRRRSRSCATTATRALRDRASCARPGRPRRWATPTSSPSMASSPSRARTSSPWSTSPALVSTISGRHEGWP